MTEQTHAPDPVFSRICEASARLMAGTVTRSTIKDLQKACRADGSGYPWETVVDRILEERSVPDELMRKALQSQRDWVMRGGREAPGKGVRQHAKSFAAKTVARLIFIVIFMVCAVALLILLNLRWPDLDIYAANGWFRTTFPGLFPPR